MVEQNAIRSIAEVVIAVGVILVWWQLRELKSHAFAALEDKFTQRYREITSTLPVEALLGEMLDLEGSNRSLGAFYRYVDLSNEQVLLRQRGGVRLATWTDWSEGMKKHLGLPAFAAAWSDIKRRAPHSFGELRRLERDRFATDPLTWPEES